MGTKTIGNMNGNVYKIHIMIMVDTVISWFELSQMNETPNVSILCHNQFIWFNVVSILPTSKRYLI